MGGDASICCSHASTGGQLEQPSEVNNSMRTGAGVVLGGSAAFPRCPLTVEASMIKAPKRFRNHPHFLHNILGTEVIIIGSFTSALPGPSLRKSRRASSFCEPHSRAAHSLPGCHVQRFAWILKRATFIPPARKHHNISTIFFHKVARHNSHLLPRWNSRCDPVMSTVSSAIPPVILIDKKALRSLHRQIYDGFRAAVLRGDLRHGGKRSNPAESSRPGYGGKRLLGPTLLGSHWLDLMDSPLHHFLKYCDAQRPHSIS
jgi:hypothetical protein